MKKRTHLYLLLACVVLAAVLRLWQFGEIPQGLQVDEAAFGYNAYSLLKTGKDEYGVPHPVTLRSYNDQKAALYAYVDIPFIMMMGLNPISVRIPTAILGILFVVLLYVTTLELTKDKTTALIAAALCAISPTMIFQNRIQSDPMLGMFLIVLGFYSFLLWVRSQRWIFLTGSIVMWGLSLIAYQSSRVFLLVFLPLVLWYFWADLRKNMRLILVGGFILIVIAIAYLTASGGARFNQTSTFTTPEVKLVLEESIREEGQIRPVVTRFFDNKLVYYGRALVNNYFSYLNVDFLFLQTQFPTRESLLNTGFLYIIELPFLLIGIYKIIKKRVRWGYFILGWLVLTPLALAPFISESPNIHRFLLAVLPLEVVVGFGIKHYFETIKKRQTVFMASLFVVPIFFLLCLVFFLNQLFVHQPVHRPWQRSYAFQELMTELKKDEPKYNKIIVTNSVGNSYMMYLFYNQYDPAAYQLSGSKGNDQSNRLGKYEFSWPDCPLGKERNVLYVVNGMVCVNHKNYYKEVKVIHWADNTAAFKLYEYTP
jgi:4-amino-4-deoxy-L-arabinose transferase-like glycosyltransferase